MNQYHLLMEVQNSIVLENYGVILLPDFPIPQSGWNNHVEVIELRFPDGSIRNAESHFEATHFSVSDPRASAVDRYRIVIRIKEIHHKVPIGTQVCVSQHLFALLDMQGEC